MPHDPEGYYASMVNILTLFPYTEAQAGINKVMAECKDPPSRFELRQACESFAAPRRRAAERERAIAQQLAERRQIEYAAEKEPLEVRKAVVESFFEFLRSRGLTPASDPRPHGETPATVKARHGLSQADWDAIPDAPNPGSDAWKRARGASGQ